MVNVVDFPNVSLVDVPNHLRKLADDIENGVYGDVGCCAISMMADELNVFGFGPDSAGPSTGITLFAGAQFIAQSLLDHGGGNAE